MGNSMKNNRKYSDAIEPLPVVDHETVAQSTHPMDELLRRRWERIRKSINIRKSSVFARKSSSAV